MARHSLRAWQKAATWRPTAARARARSAARPRTASTLWRRQHLVRDALEAPSRCDSRRRTSASSRRRGGSAPLPIGGFRRMSAPRHRIDDADDPLLQGVELLDESDGGFAQRDPTEDKVSVPGTARRLFEINGIKAGVAICHEGWRYPETVRWAAVRGAKVVFHPHHTGNPTGRKAYWCRPSKSRRQPLC